MGRVSRQSPFKTNDCLTDWKKSDNDHSLNPIADENFPPTTAKQQVNHGKFKDGNKQKSTEYVKQVSQLLFYLYYPDEGSINTPKRRFFICSC